MLIKCLLGSLITEALVELVRKSKPLQPVREYFQQFNFFEEILNCGWCCSFWIGLFVACFIKLCLVNNLIDIFFSGIVYHRCSNWLHYCIDILQQTKAIKQFSER